MIYLLTIIFIFYLIIRYDIRDNKANKDFYYAVTLVILILISGLRYRLGVDTTRYITRFYHLYTDLWHIKWDDFSFGADPLYMLVNSVVISLGGKFYMVQLIHASFVNILIFKYIKKHTPYIFTTVLLYFVICYPGYNFDILRASMSISICLFANDYLYERKYVKALILYLVGTMFHFSTLLILFVSFISTLFKLKLNKYGYLAILLSFYIGYYFRNNFSDFYDYFSMLQLSDQFENKMAINTQNDDFMSAKLGLNFWGYIGLLMPMIFPFISFILARRLHYFDKLKRLETSLFLGIILYVISISVPIVDRFATFYYVIFLIFDSFLFINVVNRYKKYNIKLGIAMMLLLISPLVYFSYRRTPVIFLHCYYPYSSVFDKTIDKERERAFLYYGGDKPVVNEY